MIYLSSIYKSLSTSRTLPLPELLPYNIVHGLFLDLTFQPGNDIEVLIRATGIFVFSHFGELVAELDKIFADILLAAAQGAAKEFEYLVLHRIQVFHFGQETIDRFDQVLQYR